MILKAWHGRKTKLEHDYAIAGWAFSVIHKVRDDVRRRMKGVHRDAIERVVTKIHMAPCPNPSKKAQGYTTAQLLHKFWEEWDTFHKKEEPFHLEARWNSPYVANGQSWKWHKRYSHPYTEVFGFVACRVTSKCLGIGSAERSWGKAKAIKTGHRSHMAEANVEMRVVVCTTARKNDAMI